MEKEDMNITETISWYPANTMNKVLVGSSIHWTSDRPLEVTLTFNDGSDSGVIWVFSLDLFRQARESGAAGLGDVHVEVGHGTVTVTLTSPFGAVELRTTDALIRRFTDKVYEVSPWKADPEELSFSDAELADWLKAS